MVEELRWSSDGVELDTGACRAWADAGHVRRIVENLLGNAAKYGAPPVVVTTEVRGATAVIAVRDHGDGVPEHLGERLFVPFTQGESGPARRGKGVGLGLAIARQLAELNGGTLTLEPCDRGGALRAPAPECGVDHRGPAQCRHSDGLTLTSLHHDRWCHTSEEPAVGTLRIANTYTIDAPADRLWEILVDQFTDVASWASGLDGSGPNPNLPVTADGDDPTGRACVVPGLGATDERITVFRPADRTFGYSVDAEKIPSFVHGMENIWTLVPKGSNRTEVRQVLQAEVRGVGNIMKPVMKLQFGRLLSTIQEDLRAYAVTGDVSAQKAKELAKAGR